MKACLILLKECEQLARFVQKIQEFQIILIRCFEGSLSPSHLIIIEPDNDVYYLRMSCIHNPHIQSRINKFKESQVGLYTTSQIDRLQTTLVSPFHVFCQAQ